MSKLNFNYDPDIDVMTIEGVKYHGDLFRSFSENGLELNQPFKIVQRDKDGTILETLREYEDLLDEVCGGPLHGNIEGFEHSTTGKPFKVSIDNNEPDQEPTREPDFEVIEPKQLGENNKNIHFLMSHGVLYEGSFHSRTACDLKHESDCFPDPDFSFKFTNVIEDITCPDCLKALGVK